MQSDSYAHPFDQRAVDESEKVQAKFVEFQRRIDDMVVGHYPQMIQTMITERNYSELARFGEAFKSRTDFSDTYRNTTGIEITVRDHHDLHAYMYLNSNLAQQEVISFKHAVEYVRKQMVKLSQTALVELTKTQLESDVVEQAGIESEESSDMSPEEQRELFFEICMDEKDELFEQYSGYMHVVMRDLNDELVLMRDFLSNPAIHELMVFCNTKHEVKATKPYNLFTTLSPEERMEIVRGGWSKANLFNRSPLYPAFLLMMYPNEANISHDVCIRHPYLMASREYTDELASSIVSFSRSEPVIRQIVKSYAENFGINETSFLITCLNKTQR